MCRYCGCEDDQSGAGGRPPTRLNREAVWHELADRVLALPRGALNEREFARYYNHDLPGLEDAEWAHHPAWLIWQRRHAPKDSEPSPAANEEAWHGHGKRLRWRVLPGGRADEPDASG